MSADLSLVHIVRSPRPTLARPPMLLLLHGIGSNEQDLFGFADMIDARFLVLSARAPLTLGPNAYAWYHTQFMPGGPIAAQEEAEASRLKLIQFVEEAARTYDTDAARTYLLGFSQGAIMSMSVTLTRPDLVAGVVMLSGRIIPDIRTRMAPPEALAGRHVFVGHGTADETLPIHHARATRELLTSLPVELAYHEYPAGHTVPYEELGDITAWLAERLNVDAALR